MSRKNQSHKEAMKAATRRDIRHGVYSKISASEAVAEMEAIRWWKNRTSDEETETLRFVLQNAVPVDLEVPDNKLGHEILRVIGGSTAPRTPGIVGREKKATNGLGLEKQEAFSKNITSLLGDPGWTRKKNWLKISQPFYKKKVYHTFTKDGEQYAELDHVEIQDVIIRDGKYFAGDKEISFSNVRRYLLAELKFHGKNVVLAEGITDMRESFFVLTGQSAIEWRTAMGGSSASLKAMPGVRAFKHSPFTKDGVKGNHGFTNMWARALEFATG